MKYTDKLIIFREIKSTWAIFIGRDSYSFCWVGAWILTHNILSAGLMVGTEQYPLFFFSLPCELPWSSIQDSQRYTECKSDCIITYLPVHTFSFGKRIVGAHLQLMTKHWFWIVLLFYLIPFINFSDINSYQDCQCLLTSVIYPYIISHYESSYQFQNTLGTRVL